MFDAISVGDVTEDVFIQAKELCLVCMVENKKEDCLLCMKFSDKIAAQRVDKLIGGNAGNFAIGSRRLGLKSALWSTVGDDEQGRLILNSLKANDVSTKYFTLAKGEKTNFSVIINYGAERTILVHHEKRHYKFRKLEPAKLIYVTSMGKGSEKLFPGILKYKNKHKVMMGFNPGTHQLKLGLKGLNEMLAQSDVVSINVEETQFLFKCKIRDIRYLLKKLWNTGTKIAVLTDGPAGSYAYDGKEFYFCPIYDVPILERTGCGDSFTTGFMVAIYYGKDIKEAMRRATINSASVIQKIGPQEGLIKRSMLNKILKANPKFSARRFTGSNVTRNTKYKPVKYKQF